jgi:hypothetical protein
VNAVNAVNTLFIVVLLSLQRLLSPTSAQGGRLIALRGGRAHWLTAKAALRVVRATRHIAIRSILHLCRVWRHSIVVAACCRRLVALRKVTKQYVADHNQQNQHASNNQQNSLHTQRD